jgi:hypothetical protein
MLSWRFAGCDGELKVNLGGSRANSRGHVLTGENHPLSRPDSLHIHYYTSIFLQVASLNYIVILGSHPHLGRNFL